LNKIILFVVVSAGALAYFANIGVALPVSEKNEDKRAKQNEGEFYCDGRQYCSQMKSYDEAKFFLDNCPNTKMDGDNDGIPCERQFGR
jgi:hypothetical protein